MQYDFLKQFPDRMRTVGAYSFLIKNSIQKDTWMKYDMRTIDERINMIFAVLLYIMEQSLKEENCTIDDIAAFIDNVNTQYLKKPFSYEDCKLLGDFIVNVILANEGKAMYFDGYNFETDAYEQINVSYIANRIIYIDHEVKRTSYYLTEEGYNLLLGTLEIENNMRLTIHEMIFHMHLEKQNYDKAVSDIKNIFKILHSQLIKIQEAMEKVKRNALDYSVKDYEEIMHSNLDTINDTKSKFKGYKDQVKVRVEELEQIDINVRRLEKKEEENLVNLKIIESYLTRTLDEYQRILNKHFDLKAMYTKELELLSQMSLIKRFSFRTELYDKVLQDADSLGRLEHFLRPLFNQDPEKIYNLKKSLDMPQISKEKLDEEEAESIDFDEEAWEKEQERRNRERLNKYEQSLAYILDKVISKGEISLAQMQEQLAEQDKDTMIPNVEIFKEIMVELIKNKEIQIPVLQKERSEFIGESVLNFQLNGMILQLIEQEPEKRAIQTLRIERAELGDTVLFEAVKDEAGNEKTIRCSNVVFSVE